MKMRKKLAALLAAAMIASVMPMTAFADTTNRIVSSSRVERGGTTQGRAPELVIENGKGDVDFATSRDFYLKLEGAEFLTAGAILYTLEHGNSVVGAYNNDNGQIDTRKGADGYYTVAGAAGAGYGGVKFRLDRDNRLAINVPSTKDYAYGATKFSASGEFRLPILAKVTDEAATVTIDGNGTGITSGLQSVFATTGTSKTTVVIEDVPSIYYGLNEELATIVLRENFAGALKSVDDDLEMIVELDSSDYDFVVNRAGTVAIKGIGGLGDVTANIRHNGRDGKDKQSVTITIPGSNALYGSGNQAGEIEFALTVDANTKNPEVGDLKAELRSDFFTRQTVTLAKVAKFGVEIVPKEDYDFITGQKETVTFNFNELVADSLVDGRPVEFALPEGVRFTKDRVKIDGKTPDRVKIDGKTPAANTISYFDGDTIKNDKPETFTVELPTDRTKLDKFKIEVEIQIESAFAGDIELTATGRAVEEAVSVVLAKTTPPVKVTVEPIQVKAGLKVQTGGKIVIEETDKARLMRGQDIVIALEEESGMTLTDAKLTITDGDLKTDDIEVKSVDGELRILVKRQSKEASTIELTDIKLKIDRSVPIGNYEVSVGGPAISKLATDAHIATKTETETVRVTDAAGNVTTEIREITRKGDKVAADHDPIAEKDFILLGDPILGLKSTVVFTIGSSKYTVDGIEHTMDASAYIKDGRTMVPVRYLADALGVSEENIKFNAGIVTIFVDNGNVVQLKVNSKDLVTNGMTIPMVAAAEIIEGRTYVPVTEIGAVFGVTGTWDSAAQTATFAK